MKNPFHSSLYLNCLPNGHVQACSPARIATQRCALLLEAGLGRGCNIHTPLCSLSGSQPCGDSFAYRSSHAHGLYSSTTGPQAMWTRIYTLMVNCPVSCKPSHRLLFMSRVPKPLSWVWLAQSGWSLWLCDQDREKQGGEPLPAEVTIVCPMLKMSPQEGEAESQSKKRKFRLASFT